MKYTEFLHQTSFAPEELLAFAHGRLIDDAPVAFRTRLPAPPLLMVDRIPVIEHRSNRGRIVGERDVRLDDWFFQCHFLGDPVQPGCLGVDAIWQLLGFYCALRGALGSGRALGCGEIEFSGQIRPHDRCVRYEINVVRYVALPESGSSIAIGDGLVLVDGEPIYSVKRAKVGIFKDMDYADYPWPTARGQGGRMES